MSIFANREDLEGNANPLDTNYAFDYEKQFESGRTGKDSQSFRMSSLPVLRREDGEYWCFVRPEGTAEGYQVCWIRWDGEDPQIDCRIRTSRFEFEEYLAGVRSLMVDYRAPEKRNQSQLELYELGLKNMTQIADPVSQAMSPNNIRTQKQGIPKLDGFLATPIENDLELEKMSQQVIGLIHIPCSLSEWSLLF